MEKYEAPTIKYPDIAKDLLQMAEADQRMRREGPLDESVDKTNTQRMQEIVGQIGWPTISKVGKEASDAAWLIAQHADLNVDFQEQCLEAMSSSPEGEVEKEQIAYLTDRVRVNRGQKQLYGTQFYTNKETQEFGPKPIEDLDNLEERRSSMGLESFEDYKERMVGGK